MTKEDEEVNEVFRKLSSNRSTKTMNQLSEWQSSLINENIKVNKPSDLAKLLFVLRSAISADDWPKDASDHELRQLTIEKVGQTFDDSGEAGTESCFEIALEYGFIRIETDPNTDRKKYAISPANELDSSHDWFCFDCDVIISKNSRQFLKCHKCLRVFHRKCAEEFDDIKDFKCRYCEAIEQYEHGYINQYQTIEQLRINRVIGFLLDFVKSKMKANYEDIDLEFEDIYVFKRMSLSLMREKVDKNGYKSISDFDDDFFLFMHNLLITQIHFETIHVLNKFAKLRIFMLKELNELKKCVDCYERANNKELQESDKEWFSIPCDPPHKPVFVKLRNNPYWPAKVIGKNLDNKRIEVCFFEAEKSGRNDRSKKIRAALWKCEVKPSEMKDINDLDILDQIKNNQRLIKPMELVIKYLELRPDRNLYDNTIEIIKQNIFALKSSTIETDYDSTEPMDSINQSIESVIAKTMKTPAKSKSGRKKEPKTTSKVTPKPTRKQKEPKKKIRVKTPQSSNPSTCPSSPVCPILMDMVGPNASDSVDSLSDRVPDLNISEDSEPPTLDAVKGYETLSTSKRRSGRLAALTTPKNTDTVPKTKSESKSSKVLKRKDQNKSIYETQLMEVDGEDSQQMASTNESFMESGRIDSMADSSNSVLNYSDQIPNRSQSLTTIESNISTESPINLCLKTSDSIIVETSSQVVTIDPPKMSQRVATDVSQSTTASMAANQQNIPLRVEIADISSSFLSTSSTAQSMSAPSVCVIEPRPSISTVPSMPTTSIGPIMSEPLTTYATTTSFEGSVNKENDNNISNQTNAVPNSLHNNEMADRFAKNLQELNQLTLREGPTVPKMELAEKLLIIDFYFKGILKQMDSLQNDLKQTQNQLENVKTQRWCTVCQRLAKHFCCIRFYCSQDCQKIDWRNGHYEQCLDRQK